MEAKSYHCPVEATIEVIGGKWKPLILWWLTPKNVSIRRFAPTNPRHTGWGSTLGKSGRLWLSQKKPHVWAHKYRDIDYYLRSIASHESEARRGLISSLTFCSRYDLQMFRSGL